VVSWGLLGEAEVLYRASYSTLPASSPPGSGATYRVSSPHQPGIYFFKVWWPHATLFRIFIFLSDDNTLQDITSHNFLYDEAGVYE
jgi:hypothetical protein